MGEFVGREKELRTLKECEGRGKAVLVYGRRRIGKSTLLRRFSATKNTLYLTCIDNGTISNFDYFTEKISEFLTEPIPPITNWTNLEKMLVKVLQVRRTILVIDEYPYLREGDRSADSYFQHIIDTGLDGTESTLVLCGSSVSVMRGLFENGQGPLYGRFFRIMEVGPLSVSECASLHPGLPWVDNLRLYLTVGGIPRYHDVPDVGSYDGYITRNCAEEDWIAEEVSFLLKSDYQNARKIAAVLSAISNGSVSAKNIAEATGIDDSTCSRLLGALTANGAVDTVHPMLNAPKRPVYRITDNLTAFCYEVLFPRRDLFMKNDFSIEPVRPYLSTFLGRRFELFCRDWLCQTYNVTEIGSWWMDDSRKDIHEEIDIVARLRVGNSKVDLYVECKFTSRPVGFHVYNSLESRCRKFMEQGNGRMMLMSASGFDEELIEFAGPAGILLVGADELSGRKAPPRITL